MRIKRITRTRMLAAATGLAAVAALAAPTAASADTPDGGLSADRLASAGASVLRADVAGTAWHTDPATGTLVVTADSTVSAADIARIKREAGTAAAALRIERTPASSPSWPPAATPSTRRAGAARSASTCAAAATTTP